MEATLITFSNLDTPNTFAYTVPLASCCEKCMFMPLCISNLISMNIFFWHWVFHSCLSVHLFLHSILPSQLWYLKESWGSPTLGVHFHGLFKSVLLVVTFKFCSCCWSRVQLLIWLIVRLNSFAKTTFYSLKITLIELAPKPVNWWTKDLVWVLFIQCISNSFVWQQNLLENIILQCCRCHQQSINRFKIENTVIFGLPKPIPPHN